ncbi:hypothetical protein K438DRAFT_1755875 [Mycena galopus ATCC 62051]|nr:hypothetical protein K438DRAFT_1755875 [Mycena galopus ATCC 62051]
MHSPKLSSPHCLAIPHHPNSYSFDATRLFICQRWLCYKFSLLAFITPKLARTRSRSSPSPSPHGGKGARTDSRKRNPKPKRVPDALLVDWSTSYQGGESSSPSHSHSDDDESDDHELRGRVRLPAKVRRTSSPPRVSFTRSRSPRPHQLQPALSPIISLLNRRKLVVDRTALLPGLIELHFSVPCTRLRCSLAMDSRRAGESFVLLGSLLFAALRISHEPSESFYNNWISYELYALLTAALMYMLYTYGALSDRTTPIPDKPPSPQNNHLQSSQTKRKPDDKFSFVWMSVPKNYRDSSDDGILTALLLGPLVSAALLCTALAPTEGDGIPNGWAIEPPFRLPARNTRALPPHEALVRARYNLISLSILTGAILLLHVCASRWLEEHCRRAASGPAFTPSTSPSPCPVGVNGSATSSSSSLAPPAQIHGNGSSSANGNGNGTAVGASEGERRSVPRSEGWRGVYFILFTLSVSAGVSVLRLALGHLGSGFWQHLSLFDVFVSALFYQFALYVALRMAHRSLTLGELGLVCFGGTAVFMEFLNITISRIWPITTPYIKTYRLPTPLVVFQSALIGGPFVAGFLLAPFLVLSRHAAQTPTRRQRRQSPADALRARKRLAAAAGLGLLLVVFGPLGLWTRWCLGKRDPWVWVLRWVLSRRRRVALLGYWGALGSVSVAGWARQLMKSRRAAGMGAAAGVGLGSGMGALGSGMGMVGGMMGGISVGGMMAGMGIGPGAAAGNGTNDGPATPTSALFAASGEFLDRAPTLGLNARRKFFHALVVVMFVPGVAFDPAFTHLAFSVAFALFVFAEYIRYFAIYPLGVAVHLFMNEFLDTKDGNSTAILSHFYLLTGCAGALWLEGPSRLLQFTGLLVLGIGDALASIVGKQHGRHTWSPTTTKTLEGSATFAASIIASAWALRLCGLVETFSTPLYVLVVALAAVLEALSDQNDNLTLPLYTWSALTLVAVS